MVKIFILVLLVGASSVVRAEEESANEFEVKPDYIFVNKGGRDPFWPKHFTSEAVVMETTDISNFTIMGFTESNGVTAVLFKNKIGGSAGYVFMDGRLYGDNNKIVEDVAGEIINSNEILLRQGDREVLFRVQDSANGPNIRPREEERNN